MKARRRHSQFLPHKPGLGCGQDGAGPGAACLQAWRAVLTPPGSGALREVQQERLLPETPSTCVCGPPTGQEDRAGAGGGAGAPLSGSGRGRGMAAGGSWRWRWPWRAVALGREPACWGRPYTPPHCRHVTSRGGWPWSHPGGHLSWWLKAGGCAVSHAERSRRGWSGAPPWTGGPDPWREAPSRGQAGILCQRPLYGSVYTCAGCGHAESKQPVGPCGGTGDSI